MSCKSAKQSSISAPERFFIFSELSTYKVCARKYRTLALLGKNWREIANSWKTAKAQNSHQSQLLRDFSSFQSYQLSTKCMPENTVLWLFRVRNGGKIPKTLQKCKLFINLRLLSSLEIFHLFRVINFQIACPKTPHFGFFG